MPPTVPGARSRSERFDDLLLRAVAAVEATVGPALDGVEFGVEETPPSSPAPWETGGVPLGRYFPAEPAARLRDRIVLYRRPIESRCTSTAEVAALVHEVLVEQVAQVTGLDPDQIDP